MTRHSFHVCIGVAAALIAAACSEPLVRPSSPGVTSVSDHASLDGSTGMWTVSILDGEISRGGVLLPRAEDWSVRMRVKLLAGHAATLAANYGMSVLHGWQVDVTAASQIRIAVAPTSAPQEVTTGVLPLFDNEWHVIEAGRRGGSWFVTFDGTVHNLGAAPVPVDIPAGPEADFGRSYFLVGADALVDQITVQNTATNALIERYGFENGSGHTALGQNGNHMDMFGDVWLSNYNGSGSTGTNPISACGAVINAPGTYNLVRDIENCADGAIRINSGDVTLRLNGHMIDGRGMNTLTGMGLAVGVGVPGGVTNVHIVGPGNIRAFTSGLVFEGVANSSVKDVTLEHNMFGFPVNAGYAAGEPDHYSVGNSLTRNRFFRNVFHGFTVNGGSGNAISNNVIEDNLGTGILLFAGGNNTVLGNRVLRNTTGIMVERGREDSQGHKITMNTALQNAEDAVDDWRDCAHNTWSGNTFVVVFPGCIQ